MKRLPLLLRYAFVLASALRSAHGVPVTADIEFFEQRIRPVLVEHCYECHSATSKQLKGGLRADDRAMLLRGGDTGPGR